MSSTKVGGRQLDDWELSAKEGVIFDVSGSRYTTGRSTALDPPNKWTSKAPTWELNWPKPDAKHSNLSSFGFRAECVGLHAYMQTCIREVFNTNLYQISGCCD
jgi:hypothetical protein